jgi:large subunit ribosomal protein L9
MKVLFLKDVPRVGRKYDVKDVADGYAQNFLFPRGLAKKADASDMAKAETLKNRAQEERQAGAARIVAELEKLGGDPVVVTGKVNEKGHLFAGIHAEAIVEALKARGIDIPAEALDLDEPLKETGEHEIAVHAGDKNVSFKVRVESEE